MFNAKENPRGSPETFYSEIYLTKGPLAGAGNTGAGTFKDLFGRVYQLVFTDNKEVKYFQINGSVATEVTANLPVFTNLTGGERRWSWAFDQAGRAVVCYELLGTIFVTRFDVNAQQYVRDVDFAGRDPQLLMSALVNKDISDSDVLIFSLEGNDFTMRAQRENYGTSYALESGLATDSILDRVAPLFLKWQAHMSDASGTPFADFPTSELYPLLVDLPVLVGSAAFSAFVRDVVTAYAASLPDLAGNPSFFASLESVVTSYAANLPALNGLPSFSAFLVDLVTLYAVNLPALAGVASFSAIQTDVGQFYAFDLPDLSGSASFSAQLVG